jgi:pyruvate kinase
LRPDAQVLAVTDQDAVARRLSLYRSVQPIVTTVGADVDTTRRQVRDALLSRNLVAPGAMVVLVSISQDLDHQSANYLKLERLGTPGL